MVKFVILTCLLVISMCMLALYDANHYLSTPIANEDAQYEIEIDRGASLTSISQQLHTAGLISQPRYFQLWARYKKQSKLLKPGEYVFNATHTPRQMLDDLVNGRVKTYQITIVEGKRLQDFLDVLHSHPKIKHTITAREQIKTSLNISKPYLEGLFLPDTYTFTSGVSDLELLEQSHKLLMQYLQAAWQTRSSALNLSSPYEALILASIVEKETSMASERARIAGVFISRLNKGMRLQTDPTVIYGLGNAFDGNLKREHLRQDNPYNTYVRHGLPPSPIALVGKAAIDAVMQPTITGDLYFVAKNDGSHYFSKTYQEHSRAVRKYQLN